MCNTLGHLSQGWKNFHKEKSKDRRKTYVRPVCDIIPKKTETHRTRLTTGGNLIDYPEEFSTPISDLTTMKLNVNSSISDVKSRYICMNVKYFQLDSHMDKSEYIMIQI